MSLFYETVKRAIQDVVAPELQTIRGDNAALRSELQRVEATLTMRVEQIDQRLTQVESRLGRVESAVGETQVALLRFVQETGAQFKELRAEVAHHREVTDVNIRRLEERMDAHLQRIDNDLGAIKERLQMAIDIHERLAALEARVG